MVQPYKICPQCQQQAAMDASFCAQCGRPYHTQFVPPVGQTQAIYPNQATIPVPAVHSIPVAHQGIPSAMSCPACSCPDVQKVSLLVHSGTVVTNSSGVSVTGGHVFGGGPNFGMVGVTGGTSVGQSALVQMLSPPAEPKVPVNRSGCGIVVMVLFGLPFLLGGLVGLVGSGDGSAVVPLVMGLGLCGGAFFVWRSGTQEHDNRMRLYNAQYPAWMEAMERWNLLFCCGRCGCVFNVHDRRAAAPQQMQTLLYP